MYLVHFFKDKQMSSTKITGWKYSYWKGIPSYPGFVQEFTCNKTVLDIKM